MTRHLLGVLPGDGIGPEVTAEARKAAEAAAEIFGFSLKWREFPFGADYYLKHGVALPPSALADMAETEALLLGAVGDPRVGLGPLEQGLLLALRFHFDQYLNLRPARSFPGAPAPVEWPAGRRLNAVVIRENTEDFYMGLGGRGVRETSLEAKRGLYRLGGRLTLASEPEMESAFCLGLMTRPAIVRIARRAGEMTRSRGETALTVATKANAVPQLYGFWNEVVRETIADEFPEITLNYQNVDALAYLLVRQPLDFGVILCPNLFGDIISDLLSALAGGLGLAPSGNIGDGLSMFEPVHGSAPALAGAGRANPLAAILSAALMLRQVGEAAAAAAVENAVETYLAGPDKPWELGGSDSTSVVGSKTAALIRA